MKKKLSINKYYTQLLVISLFITTFYNLASFRLWKEHGTAVKLVILLLFNFSSIFFLLKCWNKKYIKCFMVTIVKNWWILFIIAFPRILQFNTMIRWDSTIYYKGLLHACHNYQLDVRSFLNSFALVGHSTYFYAALTAVGEFLFPQNIVGVYIINLCLTILLAYILKQLFKKNFLGKSSNAELNLYISCIMCSPLFLGTFTVYNADFGVIFFFFAMIYMHQCKKYILMAVFAIGAILSKETGCFWVFGYTVSESIKNRVVLYTYFLKHKKQLLLICFGLILAGILFLFSKGGSYILLIVQGKTSFAFEFDLNYIVQILKEVFILNFSWIYTIIIIIGALYLILRKDKINRIIVSINAAGFSYIVFLCVLKVGAIPRYIIGLHLCWIFTAVYFLNQVIKTSFLKKIISIFLIILSLLQTYVTVDPVSLKVFGNIDTGKMPMINASCPYGKSAYTGDLTVYNYQYTYIDKSIDKILNKIKFNHETCHIVINNGREAEMFIDGGNIYIQNFNSELYRREREKVVNTEEKSPSNMTIYTLDELAELATRDELNKAIIIILFEEDLFGGESVEEKTMWLEPYYEFKKTGSEGVFLQGRLHYRYGTLKER